MILPCAILFGNFGKPCRHSVGRTNPLYMQCSISQAMLSLAVATIMLTYCVAHGSSVTDEDGVFEKPGWCAHIQTTTFCTSAATTAVATILIATKAW